jgi:hypothetical protein
MLTDTPLNPATDSSNAKERAAAHSEDVLVYRNILVPVDFPRIRKKQSRTRLSWLQATMRRCTFCMYFKLHSTGQPFIKGHA